MTKKYNNLKSRTTRPEHPFKSWKQNETI